MGEKRLADEYSDDDLELDDEYFLRTYRPLSNLPTPPPSSAISLASPGPKSLLEDGEIFESEWLGPAVHLVNLVPPSASLVTPSITIVFEMLARANLPLETMALAVCILDSLDSRFPRRWRLLCPLAPATDSTLAQTKRHTMPPAPATGRVCTRNSQLNIDCVKPEVIVLAAVMIAVKFLNDSQEPTSFYRAAWANGMWTCDQINQTERCIMEGLGYRILPLWIPKLIADAAADMRRAAHQQQQQRRGSVCVPSAATAADQKNEIQRQHKRFMISGRAVMGTGHQPTPVDTPTAE